MKIDRAEVFRVVTGLVLVLLGISMFTASADAQVPTRYKVVQTDPNTGEVVLPDDFITANAPLIFNEIRPSLLSEGYIRNDQTYNNPIWLNSLSWDKITNTPNTLLGYGISDPIVLTSNSYNDPLWLNTLDWNKITNTPSTLGGYGIADNFVNVNTVYSNPSWLGTLDWGKITNVGLTLQGLSNVSITTPTEDQLLVYDGTEWINSTGPSPTDISNWNTAYGWGDHRTEGYLTSATAATTYAPLSHASRHAVGGVDSIFPSDPNADRFLMWDDSLSQMVWEAVSGTVTEADPIFTASDAADVTAAQLTNWNTAYGWGDHSISISNLIDSAPSNLDTLNKLAAALGDDPAFSATVMSELAGKLSTSGGTIFGDLTLGGRLLGVSTARNELQRTDSGEVLRIVHPAADAQTGIYFLNGNPTLYRAFIGIGSGGLGPMLKNQVNGAYLALLDTGVLRYSDGTTIGNVYHEGNKPTASDVGATKNPSYVYIGSDITLTAASHANKYLGFGGLRDITLASASTFSEGDWLLLVNLNQNANTLTITTDAGDYFNGQVGLTSIVIPPSETRRIFRGTTNSWFIDLDRSDNYHPGNKPTASDIGALSTSGGTLTGLLSLNSGINVANTTSSVLTIDNNNGTAGHAYIYIKKDGVSKGRLGYTNINTIGLYNDVDGTNISLLSSNFYYFDGTANRRVYHEAFKPTASDIGAVPKFTEFVQRNAWTVAEPNKMYINNQYSDVNYGTYETLELPTPTGNSGAVIGFMPKYAFDIDGWAGWYLKGHINGTSNNTAWQGDGNGLSHGTLYCDGTTWWLML